MPALRATDDDAGVDPDRVGGGPAMPCSAVQAIFSPLQEHHDTLVATGGRSAAPV
jgi:hypothetical protein